MSSHAPIVHLLCASGADKDAKANNGLTAAEMARDNGRLRGDVTASAIAAWLDAPPHGRGVGVTDTAALATKNCGREVKPVKIQLAILFVLFCVVRKDRTTLRGEWRKRRSPVNWRQSTNSHASPCEINPARAGLSSPRGHRRSAPGSGDAAAAAGRTDDPGARLAGSAGELPRGEHAHDGFTGAPETHAHTHTDTYAASPQRTVAISLPHSRSTQCSCRHFAGRPFISLRDREALPSSLYERRRSSAIATPTPTAPLSIAATATRNERRLPSSGCLARASASSGLVATKLKPKVVGEVAKLVGPDTQIPSKPACSSSAT
eukprot:scaffold18942_cov63-Phaeocystis_antarctica.AAC.3